MTPDFAALLARIEAAVAAHAVLRLAPHAAAELRVTRLGWTASVAALAGRARRPTQIHGDAATPEAAVDDLVDHLDIWAQVLAR